MSKNKTLEDFNVSLTITPHPARARIYATLREAEDAAILFNAEVHSDLQAHAALDGYYHDAGAKVTVSFVRDLDSERKCFTVIGWLA
tara:strand:- start:603 stop:863 length:261 start_codon:yes stop_codon:yes gene_type:complete